MDDDGWKQMYMALSKRMAGLEAHRDLLAEESRSWAKRALAAEKQLAARLKENERLLGMVMGGPSTDSKNSEIPCYGSGCPETRTCAACKHRKLGRPA